jgi:ribosomal RNA-processing protein 8
MFAVEGWKLGHIVAHTAPKKKPKRKRDDTDDTGQGKAVLATRPTTNPFVMRTLPSASAHNDSVTAKGDLPVRTKKKKQKTKHSETTETKPRNELITPTIDVHRDKHKKKHQPVVQASKSSQPEQSKNPPESSNTSSISSKSPQIDTKLTPLQQKMRAKLSGSQFRHINEKLYTTDSSEALSLFTKQPSLFHDVTKSQGLTDS